MIRILSAIFFVLLIFSWSSAGAQSNPALIPTIANIAALQAINPTVSGISGAVYVAGYTNPNDGGQGLFKWDAMSTVTPNVCTVFQVTIGGTPITTGRWIRQLAGDPLDVQMCGATGYTNTAYPGWAAAVDATSAFQSAVTTASGIGTYVTAHLEYKFSGSQTITFDPALTRIVGNGIPFPTIFDASGVTNSGAIFSAIHSTANGLVLNEAPLLTGINWNGPCGNSVTIGNCGTAGNITSLSRNTGTGIVTATVSTPILWATVGSTGTIALSGNTPSSYNGSFDATITGTNTLTFFLAGTPGTPTGFGTYTGAVDLDAISYQTTSNGPYSARISGMQFNGFRCALNASGGASVGPDLNHIDAGGKTGALLCYTGDAGERTTIENSSLSQGVTLMHRFGNFPTPWDIYVSNTSADTNQFCTSGLALGALGCQDIVHASQFHMETAGGYAEPYFNLGFQGRIYVDNSIIISGGTQELCQLDINATLSIENTFIEGFFEGNPNGLPYACVGIGYFHAKNNSSANSGFVAPVLFAPSMSLIPDFLTGTTIAQSGWTVGSGTAVQVSTPIPNNVPAVSGTPIFTPAGSFQLGPSSTSINQRVSCKVGDVVGFQADLMAGSGGALLVELTISDSAGNQLLDVQSSSVTSSSWTYAYATTISNSGNIPLLRAPTGSAFCKVTIFSTGGTNFASLPLVVIQ